MISTTCITSMNQSYYDHIGRLMIESWSKFWPKDYKLIVYQEGFEINKCENVKAVSWEDHCLNDWHKFSQKTNYLPALKFAKKGFAMIAGMTNINCDRLIWIDADTVTHNPFPRDKIESLLPNKKLIAFFDTYYQVNPNYTEKEYLERSYTGAIESGFVIINKQHKNFDNYLKNYIRFYNLEKHDSNLVGPWFDGNVCHAATIGLREHIVDLSKLRTTNKTQTPINRCWIGNYLYHAKAKQKKSMDLNTYREKLGL